MQRERGILLVVFCYDEFARKGLDFPILGMNRGTSSRTRLEISGSSIFARLCEGGKENGPLETSSKSPLAASCEFEAAAGHESGQTGLILGSATA
jgi:hypothetical protein